MSEKQPSTIALPNVKRGIKPFFAGVKRELKKVSWPTYKETNRLFGVVVSVCVLLIVVMGVLGFTFETLINLITRTGTGA